MLRPLEDRDLLQNRFEPPQPPGRLPRVGGQGEVVAGGDGRREGDSSHDSEQVQTENACLDNFSLFTITEYPNACHSVTTLPVSCVSPWCHVRGCHPGESINSDTDSTVTLAQYYFVSNSTLSEAILLTLMPVTTLSQHNTGESIISDTGSILLSQELAQY